MGIEDAERQSQATKNAGAARKKILANHTAVSGVSECAASRKNYNPTVAKARVHFVRSIFIYLGKKKKQ